MKNRLSTLPLIGAALAAACTSGSRNSPTFTLTGKIDGIDTGTIYLTYGMYTGKPTLDSTAIVHGQFKFEDSLREPVMAYLYEKGGTGNDDPNSTPIFIEPAAMTLEASQGKFADAKISGSASETEYQSLQAGLRPILEDRKPLVGEYDSANTAYIKAVQEKKLDEKTLDSMKYRTAAIHDKFEPFTARFQKVYLDFFTAHPQSYVTANELFFETSSMPLDSLELFYDRLGSTIQESIIHPAAWPRISPKRICMARMSNSRPIAGNTSSWTFGPVGAYPAGSRCRTSGSSTKSIRIKAFR